MRLILFLPIMERDLWLKIIKGLKLLQILLLMRLINGREKCSGFGDF